MTLTLCRPLCRPPLSITRLLLSLLLLLLLISASRRACGAMDNHVPSPLHRSPSHPSRKPLSKIKKQKSKILHLWRTGLLQWPIRHSSGQTAPPLGRIAFDVSGMADNWNFWLSNGQCVIVRQLPTPVFRLRFKKVLFQGSSSLDEALARFLLPPLAVKAECELETNYRTTTKA